VRQVLARVSFTGVHEHPRCLWVAGGGGVKQRTLC
jgi:hypothetical protein